MSWVESGGGGVTTGGDYTLGDVTADALILDQANADVRLYRAAANQIGFDNGAGGNASITGYALLPTSHVSFANDTDTGMYWISSGRMAFSANGTNWIEHVGGSSITQFGGNVHRYWRVQVSDATVDATLGAEASSSGLTYTNNGATGTVTLTLRAAPAVGHIHTFKRVASFAFRIKPNTNDAIIYSGGTMADNEYLELASDGAFITLVADSNGNWLSVAEGGTLTEQTP